MMNKVVSVGRFVSNPELRQTNGGEPQAMVRFSLALQRNIKDADGMYKADFPNYVAFGRTAEFIAKYFKKGSVIGIVGRLQTGSYTNKDGVKVYTIDVIVENAEFVVGKSEQPEGASGSSGAKAAGKASSGSSFMDIPDDAEDELPWN